MKRIPFLMQMVVATTALIFSIVACSKQQHEMPLATSEINSMKGHEGRPPAYYITQSEQLEIPAAIALPANENGYSRVATYYATGVQKYKAQLIPGSFPEAYQWAFVAPDAQLFTINNWFVGTHGAGPFWALTGGADSIFAQHLTPPHTSPSPVPSAIDWLLLKKKVGTTATGVFADVDYIQRIATTGGKAPAIPPYSLAQTVDVPYTAVYRLSKEN